jgi:hypothetical protein
VRKRRAREPREVTVHHGPVRLLNSDEAALKIAGSGGVQTDQIGQKVSLAPGSYRITMVGQAPDDNTLHLSVS